MKEYHIYAVRRINGVSQSNDAIRCRELAAVRRAYGIRKGFSPPPGPCPICKKTTGVPGARKSRRWALDHDHVTGEMRGWICHMCNSGIGYLGDDVDGLLAALKYLNADAYTAAILATLKTDQ